MSTFTLCPFLQVEREEGESEREREGKGERDEFPVDFMVQKNKEKGQERLLWMQHDAA